MACIFDSNCDAWYAPTKTQSLNRVHAQPFTTKREFPAAAKFQQRFNQYKRRKNNYGEFFNISRINTCCAKFFLRPILAQLLYNWTFYHIDYKLRVCINRWILSTIYNWSLIQIGRGWSYCLDDGLILEYFLHWIQRHMLRRMTDAFIRRKSVYELHYFLKCPSSPPTVF